MNYEDEEYVRYYTRETVSWRALGWEGQAVLALMLHGKFDRAGVFDADGHDLSHAVTLVTGLPLEIVTVGLKRLLDSRTWVEHDGKVVWPKYVHAQTCRRSDKARQRESREKRRSDAMGSNVTPGDSPSPPVTRGHTQSQPVTQSRAEAEAEDPPTPLGPVTRPRPPAEDVQALATAARRAEESFSGNAPEQRRDVAEVHEIWRKTCGYKHHKFRAPFDYGARAIATAIDSEGLDHCKIVAEFCMNDGMVNGKQDEKRQKHDSLEYVFGKSHVFHRILKAALEAGKGTEATPKLSARAAVARAKAMGDQP